MDYIQISIDVLKITCLYLAVAYTSANIYKIAIGAFSIPRGNIIRASIGIVGFIYLQWLMQ